MWRDNEFIHETIAAEVAGGLFFIGRVDGQSVGVIKFQLEDPQFWPDVPRGESAYLQTSAGGPAAICKGHRLHAIAFLGRRTNARTWATLPAIGLRGYTGEVARRL